MLGIYWTFPTFVEVAIRITGRPSLQKKFLIVGINSRLLSMEYQQR